MERPDIMEQVLEVLRKHFPRDFEEYYVTGRKGDYCVLASAERTGDLWLGVFYDDGEEWYPTKIGVSVDWMAYIPFLSDRVDERLLLRVIKILSQALLSLVDRE